MGFKVFERWSPEYALNNAFNDMNKEGLDGLKKHLTANALRAVNKFENVSKNPGVAILSDAIIGGNAITVLLAKLSECDWSIKDVMKGSETSKAIVGFNYEDKMIGTIEMTLIKEEKIWKIDNLSTPKFDRFILSEGKEDQPEEV